MRILRVTLGVSLRWLVAASLIGLTLVYTVGGGDHGSIAYLILAWYAGLGVIAIHLGVGTSRHAEALSSAR